MRADHFYVWTQSNYNQWYNGAIWASAWCFGFVKKKKSSGQTFFLTSQSGDAKASSASMIPLPSYIWRVPETCGLKLIPPELLEDLVINPCPVSTSQSSFITIPVRCGSSYLGRVFFSSGRNTLHIVRWSTSLRCACTQIYIVQCPPPNATLSCDTQLASSRSYLGKWVLCLGRVPCVVTWAFGQSPVFSSIQYSVVFPQVLTARWSSLLK